MITGGQRRMNGGSKTQQTLKAQRAKDQMEFEKGISDIERATAAVQRQYGSGQQMGIDPRFSRAVPAQTYQKGEMQRRQAATKPAFQTAQAIGEREAGAQSALAQSLEKYRQETKGATMKGQQAEAKAGLAREKGLWEVDQRQRNLGFSMYKNEANRADAIRDAYDKGVAEERLLEATTNHDIRMQDIKTYWSDVINEIDQQLRDWRQMTEAEWFRFKAELQAKAAAWGAIIGGSSGVLSDIVQDPGMQIERGGH